MAVEIKVTLQDTPGTLARLGRILGEGRVNVEAIQGTSRQGQGIIQFVPSDPNEAVRILDKAAIAYSQREVLVVRVLGEPGMFGGVVLGVDDLPGAIQVAAGMAAMDVGSNE
jgi:hypothetical protein